MSNVGGFWIRLAGVLFDAILIGIVVSAAIFLLGLDTADRAVQTGESIISVLYFVIVPAVWYGYTVGKRLMGIRIVKMDGSNVTIGTMLLRYLVTGLIYGLTLGIAFIVSVFMVALRKDKRAIHDFIAGTYVTYDKPESV
ncbi:RDD family protein [Virgibacillus kimchii]